MCPFSDKKKSNKSKCQVGAAAAREGLDGVKGAVEVGMWIIQTLASNGRFHLKILEKLSCKYFKRLSYCMPNCLATWCLIHDC